MDRTKYHYGNLLEQFEMDHVEIEREKKFIPKVSLSVYSHSLTFAGHFDGNSIMVISIMVISYFCENYYFIVK